MWLPLDIFKEKEQELLSLPIYKNTDEEKIFRFHFQTIRLFSGLCGGRNRAVTDYLLMNVETFGLRYEDLRSMLTNTQLPSRYRAAVGELLVSLYIDREPYEIIQPLNFVRVWSETENAAPALQVS